MTITTTPSAHVTYILEVPLDATTAEAWRALVEDLPAWWRPDFCALGAGSTMTFDARAGGGLVERGADGAELLWYSVQMVVPGRQLHLVGHTSPDWGGPSTSMLTWTIEARGDGAVVRVRDALVGKVSVESAADSEQGWGAIFAAFAEHLAAR